MFGNPKSEALLCIYFSEQCFTSIEFHLRFTAVNAKFWDFSPSLLGSVSFICCDFGIGVSMRGTSRPVSDSGPLNTYCHKS